MKQNLLSLLFSILAIGATTYSVSSDSLICGTASVKVQCNDSSKCSCSDTRYINVKADHTSRKNVIAALDGNINSEMDWWESMASKIEYDFYECD